jgi:acyl carrier protein
MLQTPAEWTGEITGKAPPHLTFDTDLTRNLALDSLALAESGARVRLRCEVHLRASELSNALKVGVIIDLVQDKRGHTPA